MIKLYVHIRPAKILNYIYNRHFMQFAELRGSFSSANTVRKVKRFNLIVLHVKHRNLVTLDRMYFQPSKKKLQEKKLAKL